MGEEPGGKEDEWDCAQGIPVVAEPLADGEWEAFFLGQAAIEPGGLEGVLRGIVEVRKVPEVDLLGPPRDQAEPAA
jgi:hypothetical protein